MLRPLEASNRVMKSSKIFLAEAARRKDMRVTMCRSPQTAIESLFFTLYPSMGVRQGSHLDGLNWLVKKQDILCLRQRPRGSLTLISILIFGSILAQCLRVYLKVDEAAMSARETGNKYSKKGVKKCKIICNQKYISKNYAIFNTWVVMERGRGENRRSNEVRRVP